MRVSLALAGGLLALAGGPLALAGGPLALAGGPPQWQTRPARARIPISAVQTLLARARWPARQALPTRLPLPWVREEQLRRPFPYRLAPKRTVLAMRVPMASARVPMASARQAAARPARGGPVPERPDGTERGASSALGASPASRAPESRRVLPGGQSRLAATPPLAEPAWRSHGYDRACDLGRELARSEACAQNRPWVPNGAGRHTLCWPRAQWLPSVLCWPRDPVHHRRAARARDWPRGTGQPPGTPQLPGTGRPPGTGQPPGTGSAQGSGEAAATG